MMGDDFYLGLQVGCVGVLFILLLETTMRDSHTRQDAAMLLGDVLAFTSVALYIAAWGYTHTPFSAQVPAVRLFAGALDLAAAILFAYAASRQDPHDAGLPSIQALALTLAPSWLAGLWAVVAHEGAAMTCGLTTSAVVAHAILLRHSAARIRERSLSLDDRSATLLHEQMHPHLLFNSIAALCSLCESDPALAARGLEDLAGYLRGNIEALASTRIVPFGQELEHVERYVALEKLNPASTFEVAYDLQVIDFELPVLSVEPLVENAIVHGVRQMGDRGLVVVSTERQGEMVRVLVEDNGPGMPNGTTERQSTRTSRGLENVRVRLESLCGGSLHVHSDEQGTRVVMLVPQGKALAWSRSR